MFCKTLVLLGSAAATFAAPATDAAGARKYADLRPSRPFDADAFDGEWYPVLHGGQVTGCPKFEISHDTAAGTATIKEFIRSDDVSTAKPLRVITHTITDDITVTGPGLYDSRLSVTATFLGADKDFQKWAAFLQHIEYDFGVFSGDFYALIMYSRQPGLEHKNETLEELRAVFGEREELNQKLDDDDFFEPQCKQCLEPKSHQDFEADKFDGNWYPALHMGQVPNCLQFHISHDAAKNTTTIKEIVLSNTSPSKEVTHNVIRTNVATGPGMFRDDITVTNMFLGSDNYQNWAAFYQCVEREDAGDSGHMYDFLIVYKKEKTITEEKLTEAKDKTLEVLKRRMLDFRADKFVSALKEPDCGEDQLP